MNVATPRRRQGGFTLVEIATVMLVVGILSAIALFILDKVKDRTARSLLENNLRQLYQAKEYYYVESGSGDPVTAQQLVDRNYLRASQLYSLYQHGAMETNMGWVYDDTFYPGDAVAANLAPDGTPITAPLDTIYYPEAPGSGQNQVAIARAAAVAARVAPPQVTRPTAKPPTITEDAGPLTFTKQQLLALAGVTNPAGPDGGLAVTQVRVDPAQGTITPGPGGTWVFTPAPNFHGTDVPLTIGVSNQNGDIEAEAKLTITPVTDPPTPHVVATAEQPVITFGQSGTGAIITEGTLQSGGPISQLGVEFTVIGGPQVATQGIHGATFISYGVQGNPDEFYVWNPADLTVRVNGREYQTGIDTTADTDSHRYSFLWDSATGTLEAYVDGQLRKQITGVAQGYQIPGGGKLVLAQDQDSLGGGFAPQDAFHGQYLNAAVSSGPVDRAALAQAPLAEVLGGQPELLIDVQAHGTGFVDSTGHHQLHQQGDISAQPVMVDTTLAIAAPGSTLHLNLNAGAPADPADRVVGSVLSGLAPGTVLSDGQGHTHRVTSERERIDVTGWNLGGVTAQLPVAHRRDLQLQLESTTQGPDGQTAVGTATTPVRLSGN